MINFGLFEFGDRFSFFSRFFGRINVVDRIKVRADIADIFEIFGVSFGSDPQL